MAGLNTADVLLSIEWAIQNATGVFDRSRDCVINQLQRQNNQLLASYELLANYLK